MKEYKSLSHTKGDCKCHIVFIPKYRRKIVYGKIRDKLGEIFHEFVKHKESHIVEGHLCKDHVHRCISIPPKYAISNVIGIGLAKIISLWAGWPTIISLESILLATVFSGAVGIFFGFYPAHKASRLDPIQALTYE